ncbi:odorant receptor 94b-like [Chironomus tepperi]|uniref:odorant receptor 94b-like n=1 Tax=Chironomus tepperi TaxID=113505 RepID=UPI00391F2708
MDIDVFKIPLMVLKFNGVWITKDSSIYYIIYSVIMQFLFTYAFTFLMGMYIIDVTGVLDFADQSSYFFTYLVCTFKCINIYIQIDDLVDLFDELKDCIDEFGLDKSYKKHIQQANMFVKFFWVASFTTVFFGGFIPFFSGRLAYPMWFPYNLDNRFLFYMSVFYQWIGTICYSAANVMMDMIPVLFMSYFIAMFEHIGDRLELITKQDEGSEERIDNKKELLICIKYQQTVIKLVRKIEKMFSFIIFVQGLFSSIILCMISFALTMVHLPEDASIFMKLTTYMASMTSQIFIPCFYGTKLRLTYDRIAVTLFHCDWMYEDREFRKIVEFVMENSKTPMRIVAIGFVKIDLTNFGSICNSAYSLFSVLRRTR